MNFMVYFERTKQHDFFSNIDTDPRDTLQLVETESTLWVEAQTSLIQRVTQTREVSRKHYFTYWDDGVCG